jgi:hypothetical protein
MLLHQGLKEFGTDGKAAVKSEPQQLHDRCVGVGVKKTEVEEWTKEKRDMALGYLVFLRRKRCGMIKARGCADDRPQRRCITKEYTASPTVATVSTVLSAFIDAHYGREVEW